MTLRILIILWVVTLALTPSASGLADDVLVPGQTDRADAGHDPAVIARGMEILNSTCGGYCHGTAGGGFKAPALRNRPDLTASSLHATISFGRKRGGKVMPPWKGVLSEADIQAVVAAIVSLRAAAPPQGGASAPSGGH